ncbi:unnamed protein product [Enterobius vermicularis]|uniref:Organic solute transporter subunit alpha n=1 Tax=Enterobius vermicularis TaxID=51028 RepID=A0A0N4VPG9_ENTVE|nr:unnamed protein product [Enterobius vermicularis]
MSEIEEIESRVLNISKKIASIVDPEEWNLPNCSATDNYFEQPPAKVFLKNLETSKTILLAIASGIELLILLLTFLQWYQIWKKVSSEHRQDRLYYLISLFPVASLCSYIGMLAPRTALVLNSVGVLYALMCLAVLISLVRHLFGSRKACSTALTYDQKQINIQSPPCCCCCKFLPEFASTEKNLRRLEWLVLQAPVIRAAVVVFNIAAVAEYREHSHVFLQISEIASIASLLFAIFGTHTMARLIGAKLADYGFMTIFRAVDITLLFITAQQPLIFENLVRFSIIRCGPLLSALDNARFICNFLIICQMFLLSLLITIRVTPNRSALFDKVNETGLKFQEKVGEQTSLRIDSYDA